MRGKVCLVTGANSGIGKATAAALAERGAHVVMVCRSRRRGEAARADVQAHSGSDDVDLLLADFRSPNQVRTLAATFQARYDRLDVLINNAGIYRSEYDETEEGIEVTFAVNHLAAFLLTGLLMDTLRASAPARIINVTSDAHRNAQIHFDDLNLEEDYDWLKAYGQSKLANILFTYELARRLDGTSVTANCMHPGMVATRIWNHNSDFISLFMRLAKPFLLTPEKSAFDLVYLATSSELDDVNGAYFSRSRPAHSSEHSYDDVTAHRLWERSEEMLGFTFPLPD